MPDTATPAMTNTSTGDASATRSTMARTAMPEIAASWTISPRSMPPERAWAVVIAGRIRERRTRPRRRSFGERAHPVELLPAQVPALCRGQRAQEVELGRDGVGQQVCGFAMVAVRAPGRLGHDHVDDAQLEAG